MVLLSHPTGNAFVRAALQAFDDAGWLHAYYTTIGVGRPGPWHRLPAALARHLERRRFALPSSTIHARPCREAIRLTATALGLGSVVRPGSWASTDGVCQDLDRHVARQLDTGRRIPASVRVAYAYEDSADHTFVAARRRGMRTIYELPIAYWQTTQRLLHEEAARLPAWRRTLRSVDDPTYKFERKTRELEMADVVVVPSQFVLDSLPPRIKAEKPCIVARFGSPPARSRAPGPTRPRGPLRVLFAGALTQRKGLADLFQAMHLLRRPDVELVVMGSRLAPLSFYREQYPAFVYEPPRPHAQVLELMETCDILALPAIVEGRALVQQEALACGLPLIVTPHTGGDDLVDEGRTGFLVPIRSPAALAERLDWFATHRILLPEFRNHAKAKADATPWSQYEARTREAVALGRGGG